MNLTMGTRGSALALAQSGHVADALRALGAQVEVVIVRTRGDEQLDLDLQANRDKGFFTSELEQALLRGELDFAVHSLKDLPTENPPGLVLAATPPRAPTGDVLLARPEAVDPDRGFALRRGARVGTSAARRVALLEHADPHLEVVPLRGNVPTRIAAAQTGRMDAVILARAGLTRLGVEPEGLLAFDLLPQRFVPAPGQGALALQCKASNTAVRSVLERIQHPQSAAEVALERGVLARLEGGCHAAVGAWVDRATGILHAGARVDGAWRAVAVPASPGADEEAVAALHRPGDGGHGAWLQAATPWWA